MTDDLNNLRPEVREALERMIVLCSAANKTGKWMRADCDTVIIAELLRLAKAEFDLRLALQDRLGVQDEYAVVAKGWQERAEKAEAELAEARKNETVALGLWNAAEGRATKAEAELAALKARIAEAPVVSKKVEGIAVGQDGVFIPHGHTVRLLVED